MTDNEYPLKIAKAADIIGVSYKTIYNWLENGYLKLYHPGYVLLSDVRRAQIRAENAIAKRRTTLATEQPRDKFGRFI
jgi:predicted site-specific integrase-resolvase